MTKALDSALVGIPTFGMRNAVINGDFRVWQRGTSSSSSASNQYTADRFVVPCTNTYTVSRVSLDNGIAEYAARVISTNASTSTYVLFGTRLEGLKARLGKPHRISFDIRGSVPHDLNYQMNFRNGDGNTVDTGVDLTVSITTDWQRISLPVINFPAPSASYTDGSWFDFYIGWVNTLVAGRWFEITNIQIEEGIAVTPFEKRPIGLELSMCQRYYYQFVNMHVGTLNYTLYQLKGVIYFPAAMRAIPTIGYTVSSGSYMTIISISTTFCTYRNDTALTAGSSDRYISTFNANSEL